MTPKARIELKWETSLDRYSGKNRQQMEKEGIWTTFQMQKAVSMKLALKDKRDVMFLDSDQLVVSRIDGIDPLKDLGVSPHFMPKRITDKYGYYNGGMLWTKHKEIPDRWIEFSKTSRYYDQACIEDLAKEYSHFIFGNEYNIQSYRFTQGILPMQKYMECFKPSKGSLKFLSKEVKTFHTHFRKGDPMTKINQFIQGMLIRAKKWKEASIIDRMIEGKWRLWIPKQPTKHAHFRHSDDSYRMYPAMWQQEEKDVVWGRHPSRMNCWLGNTVVLYDRPTLQWINEECKMASAMYMGNGSGADRGKVANTVTGSYVNPWIFWPRDIRAYKKARTQLPWEKRTVTSVFIGNYENSVQQKFREPGNWKAYIEEFHLTGGKKHKFTKEEYVRNLGQAKYGLCLRGFGSKCHREVELMGVGTVPIVTPDVEMDSYLHPPKEGVHYIRVSKPEEIPDKIKGISRDKWQEMSRACIDWFNASLRWDTTIRGILYR